MSIFSTKSRKATSQPGTFETLPAAQRHHERAEHHDAEQRELRPERRAAHDLEEPLRGVRGASYRAAKIRISGSSSVQLDAREGREAQSRGRRPVERSYRQPARDDGQQRGGRLRARGCVRFQARRAPLRSRRAPRRGRQRAAPRPTNTRARRRAPPTPQRAPAPRRAAREAFRCRSSASSRTTA